jgi:glycosyltransferase EpsJ
MMTHDAGKTVRRAVESLQNQTFRNFELVVVDAGSEDPTLRLLDALAERDLRVVVVRADELGRQEALSLALDRARGSWVLVMDADGWAEPSLLTDLVKSAEEHDLDLAVGGFSVSVSSAGPRVSELAASSEPLIYPTQQDFRAAAWQLFASGQLLPASAKLFSRARIDEWGVRFDPEALTDHAFVMEYLREVQRVGVMGGVGYHLSRSSAPALSAGGGSARVRLLEEEHANLLALYHAWGLDGDVASMEMLQNRHLERLVACIEDVCGWGSPLSASEQRHLVSQMIGTESAQLALSVAHPQGSEARALLVPLRAHNVALVCVQARLVSLLRRGSMARIVPDAFV